MADFSDKDIAAAVRKVLVKNWVNVSRVRIRVTIESCTNARQGLT